MIIMSFCFTLVDNSKVHILERSKYRFVIVYVVAFLVIITAGLYSSKHFNIQI